MCKNIGIETVFTRKEMNEEIFFFKIVPTETHKVVLVSF